MDEYDSPEWYYEQLHLDSWKLEREKLDAMKPLLINKYKDSPDWDQSYQQTNLAHHSIPGSRMSLSRRRTYQADVPYDYHVSAGDTLTTLSFEEAFQPDMNIFNRQVAKDKALESTSKFPPDVISRISQFY